MEAPRSGIAGNAGESRTTSRDACSAARPAQLVAGATDDAGVGVVYLEGVAAAAGWGSVRFAAMASFSAIPMRSQNLENLSDIDIARIVLMHKSFH